MVEKAQQCEFTANSKKSLAAEHRILYTLYLLGLEGLFCRENHVGGISLQIVSVSKYIFTYRYST